MKIAMILPNLSNTGPGIVVQDLCRELTYRGHDCCVFYFDDIVELDFSCPTRRIHFWSQTDFFGWDVVHSHMLRPDLYVRLHFRKGENSPFLISTLHNPISYRALRTGYGRFGSVAGSLLWKLALTVFDKVIVLNEHTRSTIKGVGGGKLAVIFNGRTFIQDANGCDEADAHCIERLKQKYTVIGTVSGITKRKGLEQMIKALTLLPNYAFVAVGDGPELETLKGLAEKEGVSHRCYWTGYKKNATSYFRLFDLFVMCSRSEGFPLALIEAFAHALPTILSDIPIFKSILTGNEVAFYELDSIESLSGAIERAQAHAKEYAVSAHRYYAENLTAGIMTDKYLLQYMK